MAFPWKEAESSWWGGGEEVTLLGATEGWRQSRGHSLGLSVASCPLFFVLSW